MWRPRKVSQGTTDPILKILTPRYQSTKGRERMNKKDEKNNARHCGIRLSEKNTGSALQNHLMESRLLLGGDMEGNVKIFIQKWEKRTEVTVEERIQCGRKMFCLRKSTAPATRTT